MKSIIIALITAISSLSFADTMPRSGMKVRYASLRSYKNSFYDCPDTDEDWVRLTPTPVVYDVKFVLGKIVYFNLEFEDSLGRAQSESHLYNFSLNSTYVKFEAALKNCKNAGGTIENITLISGKTYTNTCHLVEKNISLYLNGRHFTERHTWISDVPFYIVQEELYDNKCSSGGPFLTNDHLEFIDVI